MPDTRPATGGLVLVAAGITLAITVLRLVGELEGWDPRWVGTRTASGGTLLGISWLIPVFGGLFGWHLARNGSKPPSLVPALLLPILGLALLVGSFVLVRNVPGFSFRAGFYTIHGIGVVAGYVGSRGWPELAKVDFVYGLLARVPVVVIIYLAVERDWNVHYTRMPSAPPADLGDYERAMLLSMTQVVLWVAATVILGGLVGALVARATPARR